MAVVNLPTGPVGGEFDGQRGVVSVSGVALPLRHRRGGWLAVLPGGHLAQVTPLQGVSPVGVKRLMSHAPSIGRSDLTRKSAR